MQSTTNQAKPRSADPKERVRLQSNWIQDTLLADKSAISTSAVFQVPALVWVENQPGMQPRDLGIERKAQITVVAPATREYQSRLDFESIAIVPAKLHTPPVVRAAHDFQCQFLSDLVPHTLPRLDVQTERKPHLGVIHLTDYYSISADS
jgi:hypothetical protein